MNHSLNSPRIVSREWTYASLTVIDGDRRLTPTHISFDHVRFSEPPHLQNSRIEIVMQNGNQEQRRVATVLPHEPLAMRIPIELVSA